MKKEEENLKLIDAVRQLKTRLTYLEKGIQAVKILLDASEFRYGPVMTLLDEMNKPWIPK